MLQSEKSVVYVDIEMLLHEGQMAKKELTLKKTKFKMHYDPSLKT